jgi:hypothetical protein
MELRDQEAKNGWVKAEEEEKKEQKERAGRGASVIYRRMLTQITRGKKKHLSPCRFFCLFCSKWQGLVYIASFIVDLVVSLFLFASPSTSTVVISVLRKHYDHLISLPSSYQDFSTI